MSDGTRRVAGWLALLLAVAWYAVGAMLGAGGVYIFASTRDSELRRQAAFMVAAAVFQVAGASVLIVWAVALLARRGFKSKSKGFDVLLMPDADNQP